MFDKDRNVLFGLQSDADGNNSSTSHEKQSKRKKNWPSTESLTRHADFRPLGMFYIFSVDCLATFI